MSDLLGDLPRLFPRPEQTIAGIGRLLRQGRSELHAISSTPASNRSIEWEPKVHAWVVLDRDGAIEQARARWKSGIGAGKDRGPLHGIPIGIKDIIDVKGSPTACGSKRWVDRIAEKDADVVAKLRRGRRGHHGQDGHDALCLDRPAADSKSLESGTDSGRLIERVGRGGGMRDVLWGDRHSDGRLDHPAGVVLRRRGDEAQLMHYSIAAGASRRSPRAWITSVHSLETSMISAGSSERSTEPSLILSWRSQRAILLARVRPDSSASAVSSIVGPIRRCGPRSKQRCTRSRTGRRTIVEIDDPVDFEQVLAGPSPSDGG